MLKSRNIIFTLLCFNLLFFSASANKGKKRIAEHEEKFRYEMQEKNTKEIDLKQAELMLDFIKDLEKGLINPENIGKILKAEGTELIIAQFNIARKATLEQYGQMLEGLLEDEMPEIHPVDSTERAKRGVIGLKQAWSILKWSIGKSDLLEERIASLKGINLYNEAYERAIKFLPGRVEMSPMPFIVMGGRVGAAALKGERIYFDMLTMTRSSLRKNRPLPGKQVIIDFFAHEMHHVGFRKILKRRKESLKLDEKGVLIFGFLSGIVSEGSATYFMDGARNLENLRLRGDFAEVFDNQDEYLRSSEDVISLIESGKIRNDEEYDSATTKFLGNVYHAIGSLMISFIERNCGIEAVMKVISDPRKLLVEYNKAAKVLKAKGEKIYIFDSGLSEKVAALGQ